MRIWAKGAQGAYEQARKAATEGPSLGERAQRAVSAVRKALHEEYRSVLGLDGAQGPSATARREEVEVETAETAEVAVMDKPESSWAKASREARERVQASTLFRQLGALRNHKVFDSVSDFADGMREKWETSDSPLVHRLQDWQDTVTQETEAGKAYREVRQRDPGFNLPDFLQQVQRDVPVVMNAYLEGDLETLKKHVSSEMAERMGGQIAALQAQGQQMDRNILDVGEVELVEAKVFDGSPMIIVRFTMQQINCVRDKYGNVTEGAADDIQSVYYIWALHQEAHGSFVKGGEYLPPRWTLREMMVAGMHQIT